jgi:glycosyltransferase involved in cell wall biosynthesis
MTATLTAAVLARDEARNIERCLRALSWADERLVLVDAATTDDTARRAESLGARVSTRLLESFATQRNAAIDLASGDWVLFVDADEVVSPELAAEVRRVVERPDGAVGFWIPRRNFICGQWVRHAGWHPDEQLRLLQRGKVRYDEGRPVHEVALLEGPEGHLSEPLVHYNYSSLKQFRIKQDRYAEMEALRLRRNGIRPKPRNFLLQPLREFRRRFVTMQGYRDGLLGFQLAALLGWSTFMTYWKLRRLWRDS